jgi:ribosomal protein S27AE
VQGVPAKCGEGTVLDSESVRAITCPSCGAQIHVAEGQNRTTCAYCGVELQLPHPSRPEAKLTIVVPSSNVRPKPIEAAPKRWGSSVVVLVVVLLAAAGLVTFGVLKAWATLTCRASRQR